MQPAWKFEGRLPELGSELIADIAEPSQQVRFRSKRRHLTSNDITRSVGTRPVIECVVADAVTYEPVSTPKFLANREINRKFRQIRSLCEILKANTRAISKAFSQIPYAMKQGIFRMMQRILVQEQGISTDKNEIITG